MTTATEQYPAPPLGGLDEGSDPEWLNLSEATFWVRTLIREATECGARRPGRPALQKALRERTGRRVHEHHVREILKNRDYSDDGGSAQHHSQGGARPCATQPTLHATSRCGACDTTAPRPGVSESTGASTGMAPSPHSAPLAPGPGNDPNKRRGASRQRPPGALVSYAAAMLGTGLSVDTSWRFFYDILRMRPWEAAFVFAVVEIALLGCGLRMRGAARTGVSPGWARVIAWCLCAVATLMAIEVAGPGVGLTRAALGPVLAMAMLHQALGAEHRARGDYRIPAWRRVVSELRERTLSRFGLADDARDAATRTRQRAARRLAHLATTRRAFARHRRLRRAIRVSQAAHDEHSRQWFLAELAAVQHLNQLGDLLVPSPWSRYGTRASCAAPNAE